MRKVVLFMHTSVDGFVAGPDGEMDWIHVDDDLFEYAGQRTREADTALYGRVTYQMMEGYWPTAADQPNATPHDIEHSTWYNQVEKVVVSRTLPEDHRAHTRIIRDQVAEAVRQLKGKTGKEIVIFGSPSAAHTLMAEHIIDEYWLFVHPVVLGAGIPLFKDIPNRLPLRLATSTALASGVVCLHYTAQTHPDKSNSQSEY